MSNPLTRLATALGRADRYRRTHGWRRLSLRALQVWSWLPRLVAEPLRPGSWLDANRSTRIDARPFGVNLAGDFNATTGIGEGARLSALALEAAGVPLVRVDRVGANPFRFNLIHVSIDAADAFAWHRGRDYFAGRYNIGFWAWESEILPSELSAGFLYHDEIWVPSEFVRSALAPVSPVPVVRVPHAVRPRQASDRPRSRPLEGIAPEACAFLFVFDFRSLFERKNPLGLVEAFRRAFAPSDDVWLVIKSVDGAGRPELPRLRAAIEGIVAEGLNARLIDAALPREEIDDLMRDCDCYVSLHRAEGFGLTLAEAMAFAKPVIATGYSGNLDFTTAENAYLVDYDLVPLEASVRYYAKGTLWASPDLDHAASLMRRVFEDRAAARRIGERARVDVERLLAPAVVGELMKHRLLAISEPGSRSQPDASPSPSTERGTKGER